MNCENCLNSASFLCHCTKSYFCDRHIGEHLLISGAHNPESLLEELNSPEKSHLKTKLITWIDSLKKLKKDLRKCSNEITKSIEKNTTHQIIQINTLIKTCTELIRNSRFPKEKMDDIRSILNSELVISHFSTTELKQEVEKMFPEKFLTLITDPIQVKQVKFNKFLQTHNSGFKCLAITSDGRTLITGSEDCTVRFWDLESKKQLACLIQHKSIVWSLAISNDNKLALSGSLDRNIVLWDVRDNCYKRSFYGHSGAVYVVAFCEDCRYFVSGSTAKEIFVWKTDCIHYSVKILADDIVFCGFLSVKNLFYSGIGNFLKVWDLTTFKIIYSIKAHSLPVKSIAFTSNEQLIITCSRDKLIKIWDSNSKSLYGTLDGHTEEVTSVKVTTDNNSIISGSVDLTIIIWSIQLKSIITRLSCHKDHITGLATLNDQIISVSRDSRIGISSILSKSLESYLSMRPFKQGSLMMRDDLIAFASESDVIVCNMNSNQAEAVLQGHDELVEMTCISPRKNFLVSSSRDVKRNLIVWDLNSNLMSTTLNGHEDSVFCVDVSNDERKIISGDCLATVRLWDLFSGNQEFVFKGHKGHVYSVKFTNDQKLACSGGSDMKIFVWNLMQKTIFASLTGHAQVIWRVMVTSDDKFIVSSDCLNGIVIWNVLEKKKQLEFRNFDESKEWLQNYRDLEFELMKYLF